LRPQLEQAVQRTGLIDNVRFLGALSDPAPILVLSDIVCHISLQDSFAQGILEAMSAGKPVVVNNANVLDLPAAAEECGILVTQSDPQSIAEGCETLIQDGDQRVALGVRGMRVVRSEERRVGKECRSRW